IYIFKEERKKVINFMGPFPSSRGNKYIPMAVDYLSKWVEAKALPTNDARVFVKFLKSLFTRFRTPRAIISDRGAHRGFVSVVGNRLQIPDGSLPLSSLIWWNRDPEIISIGLAWSRKQLFKRSGYSILFGKDSHVNLDVTPTISVQQTVWYMAFRKFYMSYIPRTPLTTYTDLFYDYLKKLSSSRKRGKIDTRDLPIIRRCDTTSVEEIRLKDSVISKLKYRVFKLEIIIKEYLIQEQSRLKQEEEERCHLEEHKMMEALFFKTLQEEVQRRNEKEKMLKYEEDKKKRRHELINSDNWKLSVSKISNENRTQRSTTFSAMIVSVPTPYPARLLGFNNDEEPIIEAKIPEVMVQVKVFDPNGCHGISLDVDNPIQTTLAYREHLAKKLSIVLQCGSQDRGCGYFMWMGHFRTRISSSSGPSTPPRLYTRLSTRPSYSTRTSGSALNLGQAERSNCKFLAGKIKTLEAKIKILEGTLEMERHPKNRTLEQLHYFTSCIMT
nr:phospholipase-like protein [Tanacetum cinerariifolium]